MASAATALDCQISAGSVTTSVITSNMIDSEILIWVNWNQLYTAGASTSASNAVTCGNVWPAWNQNYTASASNIITASFITSAVNECVIWQHWNGGLILRQENEQQRRAREAQEREFDARLKREHAELIAREQKARARARELLIAHLSLKQREQLEKEKVFEVLGKSGKHRYLIGEQGDVRRIDEKGPVESYCIHPPWAGRKSLPPADLALAKKLMLEFDEDSFLKTANVTRLRA